MPSLVFTDIAANVQIGLRVLNAAEAILIVALISWSNRPPLLTMLFWLENWPTSARFSLILNFFYSRAVGLVDPQMSTTKTPTVSDHE